MPTKKRKDLNQHKIRMAGQGTYCPKDGSEGALSYVQVVMNNETDVCLTPFLALNKSSPPDQKLSELSKSDKPVMYSVTNKNLYNLPILSTKVQIFELGENFDDLRKLLLKVQNSLPMLPCLTHIRITVQGKCKGVLRASMLFAREKTNEIMCVSYPADNAKAEVLTLSKEKVIYELIPGNQVNTNIPDVDDKLNKFNETVELLKNGGVVRDQSESSYDVLGEECQRKPIPDDLANVGTLIESMKGKCDEFNDVIGRRLSPLAISKYIHVKQLPYIVKLLNKQELRVENPIDAYVQRKFYIPSVRLDAKEVKDLAEALAWLSLKQSGCKGAADTEIQTYIKGSLKDKMVELVGLIKVEKEKEKPASLLAVYLFVLVRLLTEVEELRGQILTVPGVYSALLTDLQVKHYIQGFDVDHFPSLDLQEEERFSRIKLIRIVSTKLAGLFGSYPPSPSSSAEDTPTPHDEGISSKSVEEAGFQLFVKNTDPIRRGGGRSIEKVSEPEVEPEVVRGSLIAGDNGDWFTANEAQNRAIDSFANIQPSWDSVTVVEGYKFKKIFVDNIHGNHELGGNAVFGIFTDGQFRQYLKLPNGFEEYERTDIDALIRIISDCPFLNKYEEYAVSIANEIGENTHIRIQKLINQISETLHSINPSNFKLDVVEKAIRDEKELERVRQVLDRLVNFYTVLEEVLKGCRITKITQKLANVIEIANEPDTGNLYEQTKILMDIIKQYSLLPPVESILDKVMTDVNEVTLKDIEDTKAAIKERQTRL